jgi:hypothetical protein
MAKTAPALIPETVEDVGKPFVAIDPSKPFYLVFHQTEKRNNIEAFQGPDAEAEAKARASQKSVRTKARVAVLGPQVAVYAPPETTMAVEVQLDWLACPVDNTQDPHPV